MEEVVREVMELVTEKMVVEVSVEIPEENSEVV